MKAFAPFYDPEDMSACVEASESVEALNARAERDGIYFPLWREPGQALGGLFQNSRVASRSFRFGTVGENTLGLRFKLRSGKSLELGGRVIKNVVGFDLLRFLAGSQGRFGEPELLVLRLRPLPEVRKELRLLGPASALEEFRKRFMLSPWVHAVDAFDLELDAQGARLGLAYACTAADALVYERSLQALAAHAQLKLDEGPLPRHAALPAREILVPLSKMLAEAQALQAKYGGRVTGYLGQGCLLLEPGTPLPALESPLDPLEAGFRAKLEALA